MPGTRWDPGSTVRRAAWRVVSRGGVVVAAVALVAACQASGVAGTPASSATLIPSDPAAASATAPAAPSASSAPTAASTIEPSVGTATPPAAIDPRTDGLDVAFGEFAITPEAPVIRPGRVTLVVHNAGQLTHGFEMKLEGSGSGRDRKKIETRTLRSGETLRVEADLAPGVYEIECYIAGHAARGMHTTLEVRADAPLAQATADSSASGSVRIVQFAFVAADIDVPVGTRVTWTNQDPTPHTVTADKGAFDSRQLDPGGTFSVTLDTPGTLTYHCEIHPTMVGTVRVH